MNYSTTRATSKLFHRLSILVLLCLFATLLGCGKSVPPDIEPGETRVAMVEMPIGEGPIRVSRLQNDTTETFSLVMHVAIRKRDENQFQRRYVQCENEIIDRITEIISVSIPDELGEIGLGTSIRERAKQAINDVLGTPWVLEVFLTDVVLRLD